MNRGMLWFDAWRNHLMKKKQTGEIFDAIFP